MFLILYIFYFKKYFFSICFDSFVMLIKKTYFNIFLNKKLS
jgi:hypothetical protein